MIASKKKQEKVTDSTVGDDRGNETSDRGWAKLKNPGTT